MLIDFVSDSFCINKNVCFYILDSATWSVVAVSWDVTAPLRSQGVEAMLPPQCSAFSQCMSPRQRGLAG